jgi:hypothetical protein
MSFQLPKDLPQLRLSNPEIKIIGARRQIQELLMNEFALYVDCCKIEMKPGADGIVKLDFGVFNDGSSQNSKSFTQVSYSCVTLG